MTPRGRRVENAGPIHHEIADWLRAHAYGHRRAVPRSELVEYLEGWCLRVGMYRELLESPRGFDREVRALCRECLKLGWPVVSCGRGYFYADITDRKDKRLFRHGVIRRVIALQRVYIDGNHAWEAEAQRLANGRAAKQIPMKEPGLAPGFFGQGKLFNIPPALPARRPSAVAAGRR
jgi:hypothetical protein